MPIEFPVVKNDLLQHQMDQARLLGVQFLDHAGSNPYPLFHLIVTAVIVGLTGTSGNLTMQGPTRPLIFTMPSPTCSRSRNASSPVQKQRPSGGDDVLLVLEAQIDLGVAVAQDVDRDQRRMLGDADQPFAKTSDLPEHILQAVGGLVFSLASREQVVDLLQEGDVAQIVRSHPGPGDTDESTAGECRSGTLAGLGQFLVQFDDDRLVQQFLQS